MSELTIFYLHFSSLFQLKAVNTGFIDCAKCNSCDLLNITDSMAILNSLGEAFGLISFIQNFFGGVKLKSAETLFVKCTRDSSQGFLNMDKGYMHIWKGKFCAHGLVSGNQIVIIETCTVECIPSVNVKL